MSGFPALNRGVVSEKITALLLPSSCYLVNEIDGEKIEY